MHGDPCALHILRIRGGAIYDGQGLNADGATAEALADGRASNVRTSTASFHTR